MLHTRANGQQVKSGVCTSDTKNEELHESSAKSLDPRHLNVHQQNASSGIVHSETEKDRGKESYLHFRSIPRVFVLLDLGDLLPFPLLIFRTSITGIVRIFQWHGPFLATEVLEPRPRSDENLVQLNGHHEESGHPNDNTPLPG